MPIVTTPTGVRLCYDTFGDPDSPPLLLIQGLGAHLLGWRHELCQHIADAGFHVVRFDNRDVGLSQKFPQGGYDLTDLAADAHGLLAALDLAPAHVVGQSMGGMIAQQLALDHPEAVRSLALLYTSPSTAYFAGADLVDDRMAMPRAQTREEAVELYLRNEEPCLSTGYPADLDWLRELGGLMWDRDYDPDGIVRQFEAIIEAKDRTEALRDVALPTAILHGDGDRLISASASKAMHEEIPGSTLTIFPGMGHELPRALWSEIIALIAANAGRAA
ncbi:alpha/beta fold hydrolase [Pseudonocardia sp. GCM10023141]|uniref:alpha/beta fold hydrolase n=1 Tax=Pseudonocardia sp. GCM10023141 TaxID=3252653 RepID=UPI0036110893